ncbi:PAS domain-containing protein [Sinorhizobium meliloti]|uniref:PAS domain-containing protein n=1 Tax=Rhizobium meliloti TaxID=382 RepID=UPI000FDA53E7|nr:PAS domain S-box protein [Sinorhizobium meliloti]
MPAWRILQTCTEKHARLEMRTFLDRVLDALPVLVWTVRADGQIDFVNRRWSDYTGLSLYDVDGREWRAALDPDDLSTARERWRLILESGEPGEMEARLRRFDGQYRRFLIQYSPMRDEAGRLVKWCGVATDVEDFRRVEQDLRQREVEAHLVLDNIPTLVSLLTPTGTPELINRQILDYTGKTGEELKKWSGSDLIQPRTRSRM